MARQVEFILATKIGLIGECFKVTELAQSEEDLLSSYDCPFTNGLPWVGKTLMSASL